MSLDVSLIRKHHVSYDNCKTWEEKEECVFDANITHNLNKMAMEAGIYMHLWRPDELGIDTAKFIIPAVEKGYNDMIARPDYYKKFDSPNGWGLYIHFIPWIEKYLEACKKYPESIIEISR